MIEHYGLLRIAGVVTMLVDGGLRYYASAGQASMEPVPLFTFTNLSTRVPFSTNREDSVRKGIEGSQRPCCSLVSVGMRLHRKVMLALGSRGRMFCCNFSHVFVVRSK